MTAVNLTQKTVSVQCVESKTRITVVEQKTNANINQQPVSVIEVVKKGIQGEQGETGIQGVKGDTGDPGLNFNWQIKSTNYQLVTKDDILADTSSGSFTLTLPTVLAKDDYFRFSPYLRSWETNPITIGCNGHKIEGLLEDMQVSTSISFALVYIDATVGLKII